MRSTLTQFLTASIIAIALTACGEAMEAEFEQPSIAVDVGPSGPDADTGGSTDAEPAPAYVCVDLDSDGFCQVDKTGKVVDCNDSPADLNGDGIVDGYKFAPGTVDICDAVDNDCDGKTDEDAAVLWLYKDADHDGCGAGELKLVCDPTGYTALNGDCDDDDASIFPGAKDEPGDGIDSDCDDESAPIADDEEQIDEPASATITVWTASSNKLGLDIWLMDKDGKVIDGSFDGPLATELWANKISGQFEVGSDVTTVRYSLTVGGGAYTTWLCTLVGDPVTAFLLPGVTHSLKVEGHTVGDAYTWIDPDGNGCGIAFDLDPVVN